MTVTMAPEQGKLHVSKPFIISLMPMNFVSVPECSDVLLSKDQLEDMLKCFPPLVLVFFFPFFFFLNLVLLRYQFWSNPIKKTENQGRESQLNRNGQKLQILGQLGKVQSWFRL